MNKLALTKKMLEDPKNLSEMFELTQFKGSFVKNYQNINGKTNGDLVWEREKMVFLQKVASDAKISQCTRLSIYGAFTELAASGLSLVDDNAYLIPYKDVLQFQIGWKGRLEQISKIEGIKSINEPMVVYASDDFDYTLAPNVEILKHKRKRKRPENDEITHVYISYENEAERKCFIMEAHEVEKIRNGFSQTYKYWKKQGGKYSNGNPMDLPFALAFPEKYFKKTCVKSLYNSLPKSIAMKEMDARISANADKDEQPTEDIQHVEVVETVPEIVEIVDPETGEVSEAGKPF